MPEAPISVYAADADEWGNLSAVGPALLALQLRPGNVSDVLIWTGGREQLINGGNAVLLDNGEGDVIGTGDFAVRDDRGIIRAEPADGFWTRFVPA